MTAAFTLIEMSLVLVIIGLVVGGILVGRDLIDITTIRSQITQIQKYQTAMATFRDKYYQLPGDISAAAVAQYGFTVAPARNGAPGAGDGNGEIDGCCAISWTEVGEPLFFWEDLSSNTGLIEGNFNAATDQYGSVACSSIVTCSVYFPYSKLGNNSFVYVYSGSARTTCCPAVTGSGPNFFGLSFITTVISGGGVFSNSAPALTVAQAYAIDKKMDDGLPQSGSVVAQYLGNLGAGNGHPGWSHYSTSPDTTTCFDTTSGAYSVGYGNGVNCGLSFKFGI